MAKTCTDGLYRGIPWRTNSPFRLNFRAQTRRSGWPLPKRRSMARLCPAITTKTEHGVPVKPLYRAPDWALTPPVARHRPLHPWRACRQ